MAVIELEPVIGERADENEEHDHDEILCHLYTFWKASFTGRAICGIHNSQDPHGQIHNGQGNTDWNGEMTCPLCGVPVCMDCWLGAR